MANFYYVKSGGTATGDAGRVATTRSTGTFAAKGAAAYYDEINDALAATTPPADGDFIYCSDLHAKTHTVGTTWAIPDGVSIISVSDTALDQYSAGATETVDNAGSTLDLTISPAAAGANFSIVGLTMEVEQSFFPSTTGDYCATFVECTFNFLGTVATEQFLGSGNAAWWKLIDCEMNFDNSGGEFQVRDGMRVTCINCFQASTGTLVSPLVNFAAEGGIAEFYGCDLSKIMAATSSLLATPATGSGQHKCIVKGCKLPTTFTAEVSAATIPNVEIDISESDDADNYFYFYRKDGYDIAEVDTTTYLTATYDGTNEFSTKITTGAQAGPGKPFVQRLLSIPASDLTSASNYEIEFTSATSGLTDTDVYFKAIHTDNTDEGLYTTVSGANADLISTGTAHTTSGTGTWTSGLGTDYRDTVAIGALANVDNGIVHIDVYVTRPSTVINFDNAATIT